MATRKLTAKQERFLLEFMIDRNGAGAYKRAGYKVKNDQVAAVEASKLLRNPEIARKVAEQETKIAEELKIEAKDIVKRWWTQATLNSNQLTEYRRCCCRYCYGEDGKRQYSKLEVLAGQDLPDDFGGFGYNPKAAPNPKCEVCFGDGIGEVFIHDSRSLSPEALMLYEGVKRTKNGIEVLTADKGAALLRVAEHLGMMGKKVELTGKNGEPLGGLAAGVLVVPGQIASMEEWEKLASTFVAPAIKPDGE